MREIYNEGRVVGLSAYELYVRQLLSTNPDAIPMTEREWLASTLSSNSSMILRIPSGSPAGYRDFMLPDHSTLVGATVVYGSIFQGECSFEQNAETGEVSNWAKNVLDYGPLVSNTATVHPITPGLPEDVPVDPNIHPEYWDDEFKQMCKDYIKIQSGLVIQPGEWNDSTQPDEVTKYLDPDFRHEAFVRIMISEPIDHDVLVLLHGFSDSALLRGEFSYLLQGSTHKPENGDFLGPEMFPWSCPIVFTLTTDIQQEASADYREEFDHIYNLIDQTHGELSDQIVQEADDRICADNIHLDDLGSLNAKLNAIAKTIVEPYDEYLETQAGYDSTLLTEDGEPITCSIPTDLYTIWQREAPQETVLEYLCGTARFTSLPDAVYYSSVSDQPVTREASTLTDDIYDTMKFNIQSGSAQIGYGDNYNSNVFRIRVMDHSINPDTGDDTMYDIVSVDSSTDDASVNFVGCSLSVTSRSIIIINNSTKSESVLSINTDTLLDNFMLQSPNIMFRRSVPTPVYDISFIKVIKGELSLNHRVWFRFGGSSADSYMRINCIRYTTKHHSVGIAYLSDFDFSDSLSRYACSVYITIAPELVDDPEVLTTVANDVYITCPIDHIDDITVLLDSTLSGYGGEWIDRGDGIAKYKLKTVDPIPLVPFETGTDFQIQRMIQAYYDGYFTLDDIKSVWHVGDTRRIDLAAIDHTADWPETHSRRNIYVRIIDFDKDVLATPINNTYTRALLTLQVNFGSSELGPMNMTNSVNSWSDCGRRKFANEGFFNALPSYIKDNVKTVEKISSETNGMEAIKTYDKAFLLSEHEVFGQCTISTDFNETIHYEYYSDRIPAGTSPFVWLRSGTLSNDGVYNTFCVLTQISTCGNNYRAIVYGSIMIGFCV